MGEPRAITYKEVQKAASSDAEAREIWSRICNITGAGQVPLSTDGDAAIDITETSDAKREQIDRLLSKAEAKPDETAANTTTKRGK